MLTSVCGHLYLWIAHWNLHRCVSKAIAFLNAPCFLIVRGIASAVLPSRTVLDICRYKPRFLPIPESVICVLHLTFTRLEASKLEALLFNFFSSSVEIHFTRVAGG